MIYKIPFKTYTEVNQILKRMRKALGKDLYEYVICDIGRFENNNIIVKTFGPIPELEEFIENEKIH